MDSVARIPVRCSNQNQHWVFTLYSQPRNRPGMPLQKDINPKMAKLQKQATQAFKTYQNLELGADILRAGGQCVFIEQTDFKRRKNAVVVLLNLLFQNLC